MNKFKVTCTEDNRIFVITSSFLKLFKQFKSIKTHKGKIIGILGSPGTGKSSNIYQAQSILDLKLYDVELKLKPYLSPMEVYREFINQLKKDLKVKTKEEAYRELSRFDAVLFADKMLDSGNLREDEIGLTEWIQNNRLKSIILYFIVIYQIIKHKKNLKTINLVFHMTWTFNLNEKKYDLLSDLGLLSLLFKTILKLFFEVVEIKYDQAETIEIVKSHFKDINTSKINKYIQKYGRMPRYILEAIDENMSASKTHHSSIESLETVCKLQ